MSKLPQGWSSEMMGELADFIMGQAPPGSECNKSGSGTPFVKAGEFGTDRPVIREWTTRPLKQGCASDVFICVVGATAGKINLGADCAIGRSVAAIRPSGALDQHFLYRFLSTKVRELRAGSAGSAQGVISKDDLAAVEMALPPLPEQRRIVAKIDSLTGKSRRARDHLDHIPRLVEKYKQAVLAAAFSLEDGTRTRLGDLVLPSAPIRYGVLQPGAVKDVGVPLIRVCDLKNGEVAWSELRRISPSIDKQFSSARVRNGDVLVTVVGTIGRIAIVSGMTEQANIARAVARIRPDPNKALPEWLRLRLTNDDCQRSFALDAREVARKTLNVSLVKAVSIKVPSLDAQAKTVRRIETAFDWIDRLASEATSARRLIDRLDQAVLAKAFRGELVPQDRADEPASVLLDRIRAERGAAPRTRRGRRPAA